MADTIVKDRRVNSRRIVESLVESRTKTLAQYKEVMTYYPFEIDETLKEVLEDFCESMVDYTARAHFYLYNYLEENKERRTTVLKIADSVYPKLVDNTQLLLDFHDRYSSDVTELDCEKLENCLNGVGELMAVRINLEDEVINALLSMDGIGH